MLERRIWQLWIITCGSLMGLFALWGWSLRDELAISRQLQAEVAMIAQGLTARMEVWEATHQEFRIYVKHEFSNVETAFVDTAQSIQRLHQITDESAFRAKMLEDLETIRAQLGTIYSLQERPE